MKIFIPVLICLVVFSCTEKKKVKNDLAIWGLKGNVKSITTYTYSVVGKNGNIEKDSLKAIDSTIFNRMGFLLEVRDRRHDTLFPRWIRKYDEHDNLIEKDNYSGAKLVMQELNRYDDKNNMIEQTIFEHEWKAPSDSIVKSDIHFTYKDSADCQIVESIADRKGKPWYSQKRVLNSNRDVISERIFYPWDTDKKYNIQIGIYKYDALGNMLEKDCFDANNTLDFRFVHKYDGKGNEVEDLARRKDDSIQYRDVKTYDDSGNITGYTYYKHDGSINSEWHCKYQKFDATGNWVKQVSYKNGTPETITRRTVEYY